jgi:hypothetical protein
MTKEALTLALEALENSVDLVQHEYATAVELYELYGQYSTPAAKIEGLFALVKAHEDSITAVKEALAQPVQHREGYWCAQLTCSKCYSADFRLKHTAPPLPVQPRPVYGKPGTRDVDVAEAMKVWDAAHPPLPPLPVQPQRQWVGLTDDEIWSLVSRIGTADSNVNPLMVLKDTRAIEQALKGKNT